MTTLVVLDRASSARTGEAKPRQCNNWSYQATVTGAGSVSCSAVVEVSNDGVGWAEMGSLSASGSGRATDTLSSSTPWAFHRSRIVSMTGDECIVTAAGC